MAYRSDDELLERINDRIRTDAAYRRQMEQAVDQSNMDRIVELIRQIVGFVANVVSIA